jgi:hypothetical protein
MAATLLFVLCENGLCNSSSTPTISFCDAFFDMIIFCTSIVNNYNAMHACATFIGACSPALLLAVPLWSSRHQRTAHTSYTSLRVNPSEIVTNTFFQNKFVKNTIICE